MTFPDSNDYILNGKALNGIIEGRNPTVTFKLGDTLTFEVDTFGHPFYLKTLQGLGTDMSLSLVQKTMEVKAKRLFGITTKKDLLLSMLIT